ncbi:MAG: GntR family transcriptional regulator [Burkholderiales bacterium]|jgi:DNA-binding GntR family transcriptional regulator|nr:GntR family transcriptional regulator [Burkholderiales bacterium]
MLMIPEKRLAVQAYEQVLDMIMGGQLKPGTLIQERRLAEHLNMSRTPLRDALLMLEGEGLLDRQGAKGLQVRYLNLEDFIENLNIRRLLEPDAARTAAGHVPQDVLDNLEARLEDLLADARLDARQPDRSLVRSIDEDLHTAISTAAQNRKMATIILVLRRQTQMFDLRSVPERLESTCVEHLAIVRALSAGDGERAAEAMRVHLDGVRQSIIARLSGT